MSCPRDLATEFRQVQKGGEHRFTETGRTQNKKEVFFRHLKKRPEFNGKIKQWMLQMGLFLAAPPSHAINQTHEN